VVGEILKIPVTRSKPMMRDELCEFVAQTCCENAQNLQQFTQTALPDLLKSMIDLKHLLKDHGHFINGGKL